MGPARPAVRNAGPPSIGFRTVRRRHLRGVHRLLVVVAATGLLAAACASAATTDEPTGSGRADEEAWLQAVGTSFAAVTSAGNQGFLEVETALLADETDEALVAGTDAIAAVLAAVDAERAQLLALDAPEAYEDDQDLLVAVLDDVERLLVAATTAAADGDLDGLLGGIEAAGAALGRTTIQLSPAVGGRLAVASDVAGRYPDLTEDDLDYLAGVSAARLEFAARNAAFSQAIGRVYPSPAALLDALLEAGVGEGFAAQREAAVDLEPTDRFAEDHEAWLAYLDESVAIDDRARTAAEDGDIVAFSVANTELAVAAARLAGDVSQPFDEASGTPAPPDDLPGGDDVEALLVLLRQLDLVLGGPAGPLTAYEGFPGMSPDQVALATDAREPIITDVLTEIRAELDALEPSAALAADHATLLAYVDRLLALQEAVDPAALAATWCGTALALSDAVAPVAAIHFGAATTDPRCVAGDAE